MPGISPRVNSRSRTPSSRRFSEVNCIVVPFGSALVRRSRTTYRPTVTPEGSTHVDPAFTGTTSSFSCTASGKVPVVVVVGQQLLPPRTSIPARPSDESVTRTSSAVDRSRCGQLFTPGNRGCRSRKGGGWRAGASPRPAGGPCRPRALAVTSASFLRSAHDHARQLTTLARVARCRGATTLGGFQDAVRHLGATRISVAPVYPSHFTDKFIGHLGETDATVVHRVDANARTHHDLARWGDDRIVDLVTRAAHPGAEVVLLPETALHTDHLTAALTEAAGVPV
ncbi:hypothetical protein ACIG56_13315 [Nocardia fusca]|uniref:aspartate racemase/maleate isomerase family protein n=1 Tax=Nocardia fusca TaxID=941183 RepID=UPI0037C9D4D1